MVFPPKSTSGLSMRYECCTSVFIAPYLLGPFADECFHVIGCSHSDESAALHAKGLRLRYPRVDCIDFCIEDHEVGTPRGGIGTLRLGSQGKIAYSRGNAGSSQAQKVPAATLFMRYGSLSCDFEHLRKCLQPCNRQKFILFR
jgi:hypothetical protein